MNPRKKIFFQYASLEYDGIPYMTPYDFMDSVTGNYMRRKFLFSFLKYYNQYQI
jgi:hypothetical protein